MADGLTKHQLEIIAAAVLKYHEKDSKRKQKEQRDNRLFNTKLLIKNYRLLKSHCDDIPNELREFEESIFDPEKLSLEALMREKTKTYNMMVYVDIKLKTYKSYTASLGEAAERRYKIIDKVYIQRNHMSISEVMELYNITKSQAYRDIDKSFEELSVMLFGISVLDLK